MRDSGLRTDHEWWRPRWRLCGCDGIIEVRVGHREQCLGERQAQHRGAVFNHLVSPVGTPSQTLREIVSALDISVVSASPPHADIDPARLREEQLHIGAQVVFDEHPCEERPRLHPVKVGEARNGGASHPFSQVVVSFEQQTGTTAPLRTLRRMDLESRHERVVVPGDIEMVELAFGRERRCS